MKLQAILVQVKLNLKLGIIIIKSYSHRIDEIAADLQSNLELKRFKNFTIKSFTHENLDHATCA